MKINDMKAILRSALPQSAIKAMRPYYHRFIRRRRDTLRFEVHLCDHCNLNCKGCGHFSPIAKPFFLDTSIYERDCKRLSELSNRKIELIDLMGGEPLLHPDVTKFFDISRGYFDGPIRMVTNGILLTSKGNDFWKSCRDNNITILISRYPIQLDINAIESKASEYGIEIIWAERTADNAGKWFKFPCDLTGSQDIRKARFKCAYANSCLYLENGKLALCGAPLLISRFNQYFGTDLSVCKQDYVNIFEIVSLEEAFEQFEKPIPFCRYCTCRREVTEWAVSNKKIEEWV